MERPKKYIRQLIRFLKETGLYSTYIESRKNYGYVSYPKFQTKITLSSFINRSFVWSETGYSNLWASIYSFLLNESINNKISLSSIKEENIIEYLHEEIKKIIQTFLQQNN